MIEIDNVLISDDVVQQQFVCDLNKCKGGCCEEGDAGAPLEKDELQQVNDNFEKVKHLLTPEALAEIGKKGRFVYNQEFGWVTPTLGDDSGICVYALKDSRGIIKCSFEQVYNEGMTSWKKPISCHLYPIIVKKGKHGNYQRMNYDPREQLCSPGCSLGKKLKVPVYKFLKEAVIRKFGAEFYEALDQVAIQYYDEEHVGKK